jgi:hypothetical protein
VSLVAEEARSSAKSVAALQDDQKTQEEPDTQHCAREPEEESVAG